MRRPVTIGIGGAHSACGKTSIAVAIIKHLTSPFSNTSSTLKTPERWGAVKYTKTAFYSSIIDSKGILDQKNKDTGRFIDAGAEEVLWVRSPDVGLGEIIPIALESLSHLDGVIVEGNSAIEFLMPDVVIFIFGTSQERTKPSAHRLLKQADIVIVPGDDAAYPVLPSQTWYDASWFADRRQPLSVTIGNLNEGLDSEKIREIMLCVEMVIKDKDIERLLKERSSEGRISCTLARKIAEELNISQKEVGKAANRLKIKIKECELGCF